VIYSASPILPGKPKKFFYNYEYTPSDTTFLNRYDDVKELYSIRLSPTIITQVKDSEDNKLYIKKQVQKGKLFSPN